MKLAALVPAKAFTRAKSRLVGALDGAERQALARRLFAHVVGELQRTEEVDEIFVLTDDDEVEAAARRHYCAVLRDGARGLDAVVDAGLREVEARGAHGALVCMADLPLLRSGEVREAALALRDHAMVVVADRHLRGTNLLGLRPPTLVATGFGQQASYAHHLRLARAHGLEALGLALEGARFDLDAPEDLHAYELRRSARAAL